MSESDSLAISPDAAADPTGSAPAPGSNVSLPISGMVAGAYIVVFLVLELWWGLFHQVLVRLGMNHGQALAAGEWQRPVLAGWLHLTAQHASANFCGVLLLTMAVEWSLGFSAAVLILVLGSICGFCAEAWLYPEVFGLGISGGVWALAGASFSSFAVEWALDRKGARMQGAGAGVLLGLVFIGQEAFFLWDPQASLTGHLAGFAAGFCLGALLACLPPESLFTKAGLGLAACGALAMPIIAAATLWPQTQPWLGNAPDAGRDVVAEGPDWNLLVPLPDSLFASSEQWIDDAGRVHLIAGRADRDAMMVSVYATRLAEGEAPWTATGGEQEELRSAARPVVSGGRTFQFYDFVRRDAKKIEYPRWIGVIDGVCVDLRISLAADASDAWRALAAELPGEIQIEWSGEQ